MTYKSKNCIGCPDAKNGCQLTCLKVQPAKKQEKRPIAEVVKEACEIFGKYEITKGELARVTDELYGDAASDYIRAAELDDRKTVIEDRLLQLYEWTEE